MTIQNLIDTSSIDRLDKELLTAFVLGKPRSFVIAHPEAILDEHQLSMLAALIKRRENSEPLALLVGSKEFFGREFFVTKDTLIPRPATEAIVEKSLQFLKKKNAEMQEIDNGISVYVCHFNDVPVEAILDVGTGSGCIALTLALEGITLPIIGIDTSHAALKIAEKNRTKFAVNNVQLTQEDGANVVRNFHRPFLLVSNPPYIPTGTTLENAVQNFEPHAALFAGINGLDVITPLLMAAKNNPHCCGVIMEMRTEQVPT